MAQDFASVVQSPRRVSKVYETMSRLESGELQLRVRALELERAMVRNSVMQKASLHAIAACCALNVGTVLVATGAPVARLFLKCVCLLYTSPSPRDATLSRMPSSA